MKLTIVATSSLALALIVSSAVAQQFPLPLRDVTADGTWDCKTADGAPLGTVIVVESAYAFMNTKSLVDGYGKLHRVSEELVDLPNYVTIDGPLKDDHSIVGVAMRGPAEDPENFSTGIFLVLVTAENKYDYCTRRMVEGMIQ